MFLASLAALASEVAESDPTDINPVVPDEIGEIFWGAIAFFGLWILMRYVLLPPLLKIRADRRNQEIADQQAASAADEQAEQVRRDYEATVAEANSEANDIIAEARAAAEHERGEIVVAAESEIALERQAALAELESQRSSAVSGLGDDVADLAVAAASKVMDASLDEPVHRSTAANYVEDAR